MRQMLLYYSTDKKDKAKVCLCSCFVKSMKITPQKLAGILETNDSENVSRLYISMLGW